MASSFMQILVDQKDALLAGELAQREIEPIQWMGLFVDESPHTLEGRTRRGVPVGAVLANYITAKATLTGYYAQPAGVYQKVEFFEGAEGWLKAQDWVEQQWRKKIYDKHLAAIQAERTKG